MIKKIFFFLIIFVSSIGVSFSQSLSDAEYKNVENSVTIYIELFETLSQCKGNNALSLEQDLLDRNDGKNLKNLIYNDLFEDESDENYSEYIQIGRYLNNLEHKYKYAIDVEFSNMSIINCKTINEGVHFAMASIDKELSYQGQKKKYSLLIFVNLNDYSIAEIVRPDFFKKEKKVCWENVPEINITDEIRQFRADADKYFAQKDYIRAKNLYQLIIEKIQNDLTAKKKIEECEKLISIQSLLDEAEKNYSEEKYENALSLYLKVLTMQTLNSRPGIESKISLCKEKITEQQYKYYIEKGDGYLRIANFSEARRNYYKALEYKPNDSYAIRKIEQSKLNDVTFARGEIKKAVSMAEASKKYFGEAFKIMCEYEASGLLTTENYYFLTLLMNNRDEKVKKYMNLTNRGCDYYLRIFSIKLKTRANNEPNIQMREKAFRLLEEIINNRNQKPNKKNQNLRS